MKTFASLIVAIASLLLLKNVTSTSEPSMSPVAVADAAEKPNILFIMSDDQDLHLDSMDYMPKVQSLLAEKGTTFMKHYCTTALCCPSRVSLLTGKCVHNTNVTDVVYPWGAYRKFVEQGLNKDYLPLWLQAGGINTYYVGKLSNGHSIHNYKKPEAQGWTSSNFLLDPGQYDYHNTTWALDGQMYESYFGENAIDITTKNSLDMLQKAIDGKKPFFLTVAPAVPHVGLKSVGPGAFFPVPQEKWANAFANASVPRNPNWNPDEVSGVGWIRNLPKQNQTVVDRLDDLYRARIRCVAGLDDMVGDLVAKLEQNGILDQTHIIYTTDNGYHIGQHRMGPGKRAGYETDVNIPMVWRGPNIPAGKISRDVTRHTDLAPTWLHLFGLDQRPNFDGDIMPVEEGTKQTDYDHVNIEHWGKSNPYEVRGNGIEVEGSANNTYKSVRVIADGYNLYYSVWCTNEHELYDMTTGPYQMNNLLPDVKDIAFDVPKGQILGVTYQQFVNRLDALLMVLKSCVGKDCIKPWLYLHPRGDVKNLKQALDRKFDKFYASQPKVSFSGGCHKGYRIEFEGPQKAKQYKGS